MKAFPLLLAAALPALAFANDRPATTSDSAPNVRTSRRQSNVIPAPRAPGQIAALPPRPPAPEGVTDISFEDFFQMPVGPLGLELTDKIKSLAGQRVRIAGFQIAEMVGVCNAEPNAASPARKARAMFEASVPGRLLLAPLPEAVNFSHYGLCEDLPPQVVFVTVAQLFGQLVPHHPGPLLLTGTLEVGNRPEPDGRVSAVRLRLDPPAAAPLSTLSPSPTTTKTSP